MTYSILVDHRDVIWFQIQLWCFSWDASWDFLEFVTWTTDHSASASARRRTITLTQASLIGIGQTLELMRWQIFDGNIANLLRSSTMWWSARQSTFSQPFRKPSQMAIAIEWIRCEISVEEKFNLLKFKSSILSICQIQLASTMIVVALDSSAVSN